MELRQGGKTNFLSVSTYGIKGMGDIGYLEKLILEKALPKGSNIMAVSKDYISIYSAKTGDFYYLPRILK